MSNASIEPVVKDVWNRAKIDEIGLFLPVLYIKFNELLQGWLNTNWKQKYNFTSALGLTIKFGN